MLDLGVLIGRDAFEAVAPEWDQLCRSCGLAAFQRPGYVRAYLDHREPETEPLLLTARRAGRLLAVAPLLRERLHRVGVDVVRLRGAGEPVQFRFEIAAAPTDAAVVAALWTALARLPGWDMIELRNVCTGAMVESWLRQASVEGWLVGRRELMCSPWLHAGAPPVLSGHFRKNLRRVRRQLESRGSLRLEWVPSLTPAELTPLLALEAAGWKGAAGTALRDAPNELAFLAAAAGNCEGYRLWQNHQLLAAAVGAGSPTAFYVAKWAYDEAFARFSPGHLLIEAMIADGAARGRREFHFEGNADSYKLQWTRSTVAHSRLYIYRPGWKGRVLQAVRDLR